MTDPYGPAPGPQQGPPPPYRAAAPLRPDEERLWAALAHWGALLLGFIAPLVVYLAFRERSAWVAETSREALNFNLSYLVYLLVAGVSIMALVGLVLFPVVLVAYYVLLLVGAVKVLQGELYRFPMIFRWV